MQGLGSKIILSFSDMVTENNEYYGRGALDYVLCACCAAVAFIIAMQIPNVSLRRLSTIGTSPLNAASAPQPQYNGM